MKAKPGPIALGVLAVMGVLFGFGCGTVIELPSKRITSETFTRIPVDSMKISPGDVLYVRRWSSGLRVNGKNPTAPPSSLDRIPIRNIEHGGKLSEPEQIFLLTVLVTHRGVNDLAHGLTKDVSDAIRVNEGAMWNSLVESLHVDVHGRDLRASVDLAKITAHLGVYGDRFLQRDDEITGLTDGFMDAAEALSEPQGNRKTPYYATGADLEGRLYSFVSIEQAALDVSNPMYAESEWSLSELENSGAYTKIPGGKNPEIVGLKMPYLANKILIDRSDNEGRATYDVAERFTNLPPEPPDTLSPSLRYFRFLKKRHPSLQTVVILGKSSLSKLTARDVSQIVWRLNDAKGTIVLCPPQTSPYKIR